MTEMHDLPKANAIKGAFFGALVGDALCLGSHYEYDAAKIFKACGNKPIDKFMSPGEMMGGHTHGIGWVSAITIRARQPGEPPTTVITTSSF
jgi:hypothetical protein